MHQSIIVLLALLSAGICVLVVWKVWHRGSASEMPIPSPPRFRRRDMCAGCRRVWPSFSPKTSAKVVSDEERPAHLRALAETLGVRFSPGDEGVFCRDCRSIICEPCLCGTAHGACPECGGKSFESVWLHVSSDPNIVMLEQLWHRLTPSMLSNLLNQGLFHRYLLYAHPLMPREEWESEFRREETITTYYDNDQRTVFGVNDPKLKGMGYGEETQVITTYDDSDFTSWKSANADLLAHL